MIRQHRSTQQPPSSPHPVELHGEQRPAPAPRGHLPQGGPTTARHGPHRRPAPRPFAGRLASRSSSRAAGRRRNMHSRKRPSRRRCGLVQLAVSRTDADTSARAASTRSIVVRETLGVRQTRRRNLAKPSIPRLLGAKLPDCPNAVWRGHQDQVEREPSRVCHGRERLVRSRMRVARPPAFGPARDRVAIPC